MLVFSIGFSISAGPFQSTWKGSIKEVDRVTVIKNPIEPMYGVEIVDLEEELSIGAVEGPPEYMFSLISSFDVDGDGNIYILDAKAHHLKVFDRTGKFLKIIGRAGQGPGEFDHPYSVQWTQDRKIVVFSAMSRILSFFSPEGEFLKNISTNEKRLFNIPFVCANGTLFSLVNFTKAENPRYELWKFDSELNPLAKIIFYPWYDEGKEGSNPFRTTLKWTVLDDNRIVCGYPDQGYRLLVFSPESKLEKTIIKEYKPVKIPKKAIEKAKKQPLPDGYFYSIPKNYGAFKWFLSDEDGRLFVGTWDVDDMGRRIYDVFDPNGRCIVRIPIKHDSMMGRNLIFKNDRFYLIDSDEDGYQVVKRFKINWKI